MTLSYRVKERVAIVEETGIETEIVTDVSGQTCHPMELDCFPSLQVMNGDVLDQGIATTGKGQGPDLVIVRGGGHVIVIPTDNGQGLGHMIAMLIRHGRALSHVIVMPIDVHGLDHVIVTIRGTLALHQDRL